MEEEQLSVFGLMSNSTKWEDTKQMTECFQKLAICGDNKEQVMDTWINAEDEPSLQLSFTSNIMDDINSDSTLEEST